MDKEARDKLLTRGWLTFSPSTPRKKAAKRFVQRYDERPELIFKHKRLLYVGPVPQDQLFACPTCRPRTCPTCRPRTPNMEKMLPKQAFK